MLLLLPGILAMGAIVMASNILVQYPLGTWLTWGALSYPFAFLVTDVVNRLHGAAAARRVVVAGFITGIFCSLILSQIEGEFGPLTTFRIALGSGLAFLLGQMLDVSIFNRLRARSWWQAPLGGPVVASVLDTILFFSVAFAAPLSVFFPGTDVAWANAPTPLLGMGAPAPYWMSLALADFMVKLVIAVVALLPFRLIVGKFLARSA